MQEIRQLEAMGCCKSKVQLLENIVIPEGKWTIEKERFGSRRLTLKLRSRFVYFGSSDTKILGWAALSCIRWGIETNLANKPLEIGLWPLDSFYACTNLY